MNGVTDNLFYALSLIAAPAVLTNASSVLINSTVIRYTRAVDRARSLAQQRMRKAPSEDPADRLLTRQLQAAQQRALLMARALGAFYMAVGCFGAGTLISLIGAILAPWQGELALRAEFIASLACGTVGMVALVFGASTFIWETRLAIAILRAESEIILAKSIA